MEDLIHSLAVYNSDYSRDGHRLEEDANKSEERLKLSREIVQVVGDAMNGDPTIRTRVEPTEKYHAGVTRKGYRAEIYEWMRRKNLETIEQASRKLNVSDSTLKSIMSSKGKARYSQKTLQAILDVIQEKQS